jgi:hypothetical protein
MEGVFLPLLVAVTSVTAYVIGVHALGLPRRGLGRAVGRMLELAGLTVVFLVANLAIGLAVVLATRALSMRFISVYILNDVSLVALSALQGIVFGWWRRSTPAAWVGRSPAPDD